MALKKEDYVEQSRQIVEDCLNLMLKKRSDYGNENIKSTGEIGVVVRLSDKLARLRNLYGISDNSYIRKSASNESIEDTYMDIINYGIIGLLASRGIY